MNYIELINNFWAYTEEKNISSSDTSIYFAILKYNNSLNWITSFRCDYAVICQYARVSKNTFYRSLNNLQDLKLIHYEKGSRNSLKPKITVLKMKNKKGTIKEQEGNTEGIKLPQNEEQKGNLYKLINLKLINLKTYKLINENHKIINEKLEYWLSLDLKKEKEIKLEIYPTGDDFWETYDKRVGNEKKSKKLFSELNLKTRIFIVEQHIPEYKKNQPEKKYRKNPIGYLEEKKYNDEIIKYQNGDQNNSTQGASDDFRKKTAKRLGYVQP